MFKISVVCLYFVVVAVNFWNVNCTILKGKEAITEAIKPVIKECTLKCGFNAKFFKIFCFKKCLLLKLGFLDKVWKYKSNALQNIIGQFTNDKGKAKTIQDQLDACFYAKGDNYGDDEASKKKRVDVLYKCLKEIQE